VQYTLASFKFINKHTDANDTARALCSITRHATQHLCPNVLTENSGRIDLKLFIAALGRNKPAPPGLLEIESPRLDHLQLGCAWPEWLICWLPARISAPLA